LHEKSQGIRAFDAQMANKMEQKETREAFSPEMADSNFMRLFQVPSLAAVEIRLMPDAPVLSPGTQSLVKAIPVQF